MWGSFTFKAWILNEKREGEKFPPFLQYCYELYLRLFWIISSPLRDSFTVLSLAHFGLSLYIHVFVYIMHNSAASLDKPLSSWTTLRMIHMQQYYFSLNSVFNLHFYLQQLVSAAAVLFAEYWRASFGHRGIESASKEKVIVIHKMRSSSFALIFVEKFLLSSR